jgi:AbrB family looped-hinge helix DNA binding protein
MFKVKTKLSADGRVVIPVAVREALNLRPGDEVIMRVDDGELRLSTRRQALARAPDDPALHPRRRGAHAEPDREPAAGSGA